MPVPGYEPGFLGLKESQGTPNVGPEANQTSSVAQMSGTTIAFLTAGLLKLNAHL